MLRNWADQMNGMNSTVDWVEKQHPDEAVIFASAATILQTSGNEPVGWSFKRFFQRRGVAVFTRNHLFLQSSFYSLFTLLHVVIIINCLILYMRNQNFILIPVIILSIMFILQRLPYQKKIPLTSIEAIKLNPVYGATGKHSLLTVIRDDKSINIVTSQNITEEVSELLSSYNENDLPRV
ncbi:MAG: hypothetical protein AAF485_29865 [Chloroflexota bacterium]